MLNYYPMGQYFKIVNLDKKEYLAPHDFGEGAKLLECWESITTNLILLLVQGFDPEDGWERDAFLGRWAGDRITVIGDYDESGLYGRLNREDYKNISLEIQEFFRQQNEMEMQNQPTSIDTSQSAEPPKRPTPYETIDDLPDPFLDE